MIHVAWIGVLALFALRLAGSVGSSTLQHRGPTVSSKQDVAPDVGQRHAWLYVGSDVNNVVTAYDLERAGFPLVRTITQGLDYPGGLAVDASGTLYVANEHSATVTLYAPGSNRPSLSLTGTSNPESVTLDASGNVYVANRGSKPGISVYPPGQTTPSRYVTSSLIQVPNQMVFDARGALYISDNSTGVSVLPPGPSGTVRSLNLKELQPMSSGLALGPESGSLYISNAVLSPYYVQLYRPFHKRPKRSTPVNFGGLDFLAVGRVNGRERLFVPDSQGNVVDLFAPDLLGVPRTLTTANGYKAVGVAYKPHGVP